MFKARQILAVSAIILIFSGWSGLAWAAGKPCVADSECSSNPLEQCCCCKPDQTCPTNPVGGKGVCFPKIVPGSITANKPAGEPLTCKDIICPFSKHVDINAFITAAVDYIFYVSVILAPLMIIIGAFLFLTSAGSPKQSKLGGDIIKWTAIGFAIILFAKGISAIIKMILVG